VVSKQGYRPTKPIRGHRPGCKPHSRFCPHTSTPPGPGYGQPPVPLTMPFGP